MAELHDQAGWLNRSLKSLLTEEDHFTRFASGLTLREYQREVARAVIDSVFLERGLSIVVMFPRQSGKNELQAQLEAYLLVMLSKAGGDMVKISPTWKP